MYYLLNIAWYDVPLHILRFTLCLSILILSDKDWRKKSISDTV